MTSPESIERLTRERVEQMMTRLERKRAEGADYARLDYDEFKQLCDVALESLRPKAEAGESPETDAAEYDTGLRCGPEDTKDMVVSSEVARSLERRLREAEAHYTGANRDFKAAQEVIDCERHRAEAAESKLARAQAAISDVAAQVPPYVFKTTTQELSIEQWRAKHGEAIHEAMLAPASGEQEKP